MATANPDISKVPNPLAPSVESMKSISGLMWQLDTYIGQYPDKLGSNGNPKVLVDKLATMMMGISGAKNTASQSSVDLKSDPVFGWIMHSDAPIRDNVTPLSFIGTNEVPAVDSPTLQSYFLKLVSKNPTLKTDIVVNLTDRLAQTMEELTVCQHYQEQAILYKRIVTESAERKIPTEQHPDAIAAKAAHPEYNNPFGLSPDFIAYYTRFNKNRPANEVVKVMAAIGQDMGIAIQRKMNRITWQQNAIANLG